MIVSDVSPVLLALGPVEIRWYGLIYALGFLLGSYVLGKAAQRGLIPGLTKQLAEEYILLLIMGGILGARLAHVIFYDPLYYAHHLLEVPAVWHGGLSIHGGIAGAVLITWRFCAKHRINFYDMADAIVVPLCLVFTFGKVANYLNGELYGTVTGVSWCVQFPGVPGCRHPVQLYEAAYSLLLFLALFALHERRRMARGVVFWTYLGLYGALRFVVSFVRAPEPSEAVLSGLSVGQWLSLACALLAAAWFCAMLRSGHPLARRA